MPSQFITLANDSRYVALPVDFDKMDAYLAECVRLGVVYHMDGKAPEGQLSAFPPKFSEIDCSGFARCILAYATNAAPGGPVVIPDGSYIQHQWFADHGFKATDYSNAASQDGHLRIAFIQPTENEAGHVWLIRNGKTLESHADVGPSARPWNTPVLINNVAACYVVR
jgi:hypothetical protein